MRWLRDNVAAVVSTLIAVVVIQTAVLTHLELENHATSVKAAHQSQLACERSREFGPAFVDFLRDNGLDERTLAFYEKSIPKSC